MILIYSFFVLVIQIQANVISSIKTLTLSAVNDTSDVLRDISSGFETLINGIKQISNPACGIHFISDSLDYEQYIALFPFTPSVSEMYFASFTDSSASDPNYVIKYFGEASAISYCDIDTVNRFSRNGPLRIKSVQLLERIPDPDNQNFSMVTISKFKNRDEVVVTFRGTMSPQDVSIDLMNAGVDLNIPITARNVTGKVHEGFWARFSSYRNVIAEKLNNVLKWKKSKVIVVGHSLGGCWAYLQASDFIINWKIPVSNVFIYGTPKCAEVSIQDAIAETIGIDKIFRITNYNDLVPSIGYSNGNHPTFVKEYYYENSNFFRVCDGTKDVSCNQKWPCEHRSWQPHSFIGNLTIGPPLCTINFPPAINQV